MKDKLFSKQPSQMPHDYKDEADDALVNPVKTTHTYEDEALTSIYPVEAKKKSAAPVSLPHDYEDELSVKDLKTLNQPLKRLTLSETASQQNVASQSAFGVEGATLSSDYTVSHGSNASSAAPTLNPMEHVQPVYQLILEGDLSEAFKQLEILAQGEQPLVYVLLGFLYEELIEPTDQATAIGWYEKALALCESLVLQAQQGDRLSQFALGILGTHLPDATPTQCEEAIGYYRQAMAGDDVLAMYQLGVCYQTGKGVALSAVQAIAHYDKAAKGGYAPASYRLGLCYEKGEGVAKNLQIAFTWYEKAAIEGYAPAQNSVATCYETGQGVKQHIQKAIEWYKSAAEKGSSLAQHNLGVLHENGRPGLLPNLVKAVQYYQRAAAKGFARSQNNLARFYETGQGGIQPNLSQAAQLYQFAADQGYARAQYNLGVCYERGQGVEKNLEQAKHYYTLAAKANERISPTAQQSLQQLLHTYPQVRESSTPSPSTPFWPSPDAASGGRGIVLQQPSGQAGKTPTPF